MRWRTAKMSWSRAYPPELAGEPRRSLFQRDFACSVVYASKLTPIVWKKVRQHLRASPDGHYGCRRCTSSRPEGRLHDRRQESRRLGEQCRNCGERALAAQKLLSRFSVLIAPPNLASKECRTRC